MRIPSVPGQLVLSDRGDNLSSVLQAICETAELKRALSHWMQELTPMDVVDFGFVADAEGKIRALGGRRGTQNFRQQCFRWHVEVSWECWPRCSAPSLPSFTFWRRLRPAFIRPASRC